MSSINDSGENEFAYEESNIVGISENSPDEKDKKNTQIYQKGNDLRRRERERITHCIFYKNTGLTLQRRIRLSLLSSIGFPYCRSTISKTAGDSFGLYLTNEITLEIQSKFCSSYTTI